MKFTLVLLIAAFFVGCALSCSEESWVNYKQQYNKSYPSEAEDHRHFDVYCKKLQTIEEHNKKFQKGEVTYEMGVNQFTDMTNEEMTQWMG